MKLEIRTTKKAFILAFVLAIIFVIGCSDTQDNSSNEYSEPNTSENGENNSIPGENESDIVVETSSPALDPNGKYIALTFDDGPIYEKTQRLLDILSQKEVKATFFVLGQSAKTYPDILMQIFNDGHEIANHTYDHTVLTHEKITIEDIEYQMDITNQIIEEITGKVPTSFRPPQGAYNEAVRNASKERDMAIFHWSWESCPEDWINTDPNFIANHVIENAANGHIILLHDSKDYTIDSIEAMVDGLKAKGFEFLTVTQLAQIGPDQMAIPGKVYFYNFSQ